MRVLLPVPVRNLENFSKYSCQNGDQICQFCTRYLLLEDVSCKTAGRPDFESLMLSTETRCFIQATIEWHEPLPRSEMMECSVL
jgi:hypothetical protein